MFRKLDKRYGASIDPFLSVNFILNSVSRAVAFQTGTFFVPIYFSSESKCVGGVIRSIVMHVMHSE